MKGLYFRAVMQKKILHSERAPARAQRLSADSKHYFDNKNGNFHFSILKFFFQAFS